nr:IS630 family transposase [Paraburkholderia atlantica]
MVVRSDPPPARGQPAIQRHQEDPSHTESNCKSIRENGSTSIRHGTTTLFAALNAVTGEVIAQCKSRHRHQEFLAFLKHVDQAVLEELDVHLIVDNYATHKHPKVKAWLAKHTRYHMHFTPTYSSWLNQVERWFGLITQQAIRRGSFRNVRQLIASIERYVVQYNQHNRPFVWTATAASIVQKVARLCKE